MPNDQQAESENTKPALGSEMPQFATAEYSHIPGTERCRICNSLISGQYYRVNGQMACSTCATQASEGQPSDSHSAFARGLLLGIGAALLGLALYAGFTIVTGFYVGYIALGVGWLIAKAIKKGANGLGGPRYQIAAVLLTYAAISMAAVPIWIADGIKHRPQVAGQQQSAAKPSADSDDSSNDDTEQPRPAPGSRPQVNVGKFLVQLVFIGLASPFLALRDPLHGAIGLFILFIGLRIAWQLTAASPLAVDGPYSVTG
jgi:hypothetical protein